MMKTVWILGAGFSKPAGFPLVRDFLDPGFFIHRLVYEYLRSASPDRSLIRDVERWATADRDLNRLMAGLIESGEERKASELNQFILRTLQSISLFHSDVYQLSYVSAFIQQIAAYTATVISFNYDTLIEEKLCHTFLEYERGVLGRDPDNAPYDLGIDAGRCLFFDNSMFADHGSGYLPNRLPTAGPLKILKLHGSISLWTCKTCSRLQYRAAMALDFPDGSYCLHCRDVTNQELLFVPPAADRSSAFEVLDALWEVAERELMSAKYTIIVGYSLPTEDRRARDLLGRVAGSNPDLKLLIVDPFAEVLRGRFSEIFPSAQFWSIGAREFVGAIATSRTRYRASMMQQASPEIASFLNGAFHPDDRDRENISGILPSHTDLVDILCSEKNSAHERTEAANMLGFSPIRPIRELLLRIGDDRKLPPTTRGLAVRAIGSIPDQISLDFLVPFLFDVVPFDVESPGSFGFVPQQTIAAYARAAILQVAFAAPHLDFGPSIDAMMTIVRSRVLLELDAMAFLSALRVLRDARILCNRYESSTAFAKPVASDKRHRHFSVHKGRAHEWTSEELDSIIRKRQLFDRERNPEGKGGEHRYEAPFVQGDWVVIDRVSGLMWTLTATESANRYLCTAPEMDRVVMDIRKSRYAGYRDWRLPTLDEALSLLQPPGSDRWCEDPIFLHHVDRIWTKDRLEGHGAMLVWLTYGYCSPAWVVDYGDAFVRAVRRM
jgi:hypothetical protein